jgi:hypothetical protein
MGILTYIKIGVIVAVFIAGGVFVGKKVYNHEQAKMAVLQNIADTAKATMEIEQANKEVLESFAAKSYQPITRRIQNEKTTFSKEVLTDDDASLRALYDHYRLLPSGQVGAPSNRPGGGPKSAPGTAPPAP